MSVITEINLNDKPSPDDFENFLPWACKRLQLDNDVLILKNIKDEYVSQLESSKSKAKPTRKSYMETASSLEIDQQTLDHSQDYEFTHFIYINCIYDQNMNLVEIKFDKINKSLSAQIFKAISLIIQSQCYLTAITIRSGLNNYILHELQYILKISNITDVCLDDAYVSGGNYHVLLEETRLRQLSLRRCGINDDMVNKFADLLTYPSNASKTLSILILASNSITDVGAVHLSKTLRSNRQLSYLNLADNKVNDEGALSIFNSLVYFVMTYEEVMDCRARLVEYIKNKNDTVRKEAEFGLRESDKTNLKAKRKFRAPTVTVKGRSIDGNFPDFEDPFSPTNMFHQNDVAYSFGNNKLAYLNFAYNNLTIFSVQKLLDVVLYQKNEGRSPLGLVCVNIEGNSLPQFCPELTRINYILSTTLNKYNVVARTKSTTNTKKK